MTYFCSAVPCDLCSASVCHSMNVYDTYPLFHSEECSESEAKIDFGTCIRDAVEEKINCTIPDMASGVPVARVGKGVKPLCSTPEQFGNYSQIYQSMELTSEGDIYNDYGCLPKCQGSSTWTMLHVT